VARGVLGVFVIRECFAPCASPGALALHAQFSTEKLYFLTWTTRPHFSRERVSNSGQGKQCSYSQLVVCKTRTSTNE